MDGQRDEQYIYIRYGCGPEVTMVECIAVHSESLCAASSTKQTKCGEGWQCDANSCIRYNLSPASYRNGILDGTEGGHEG